MTNEKNSQLVIDLAKKFIESMQDIDKYWKRAFFRFNISDLMYGSIASYEGENGIFLVDPFAWDAMYSSMSKDGAKLFKSMEKSSGLFLLVVDSNFDYKVYFEFSNLERWKISKINGGTGIPEGI